MKLAAIDVGTNTVRLLVADADLTEVERGQRITRLGAGVDASGRLSQDSMAATFDAVSGFVERARELGAAHIRIAGTSALRDAANSGEFLDAVQGQCGVGLEILSGSEEGMLAYRGATSWLDDGDYLVCDIGGGSTELITASGATSIDIGSVRLRERLMPSDPPTPDELTAARYAVRTTFEQAATMIKLAGNETLVGVAGTITTIAALALGLDVYDPQAVHGSVLRSPDVRFWTERLNAMTVAEVRELGPVEPGRADVLCSGALILVGVLYAFGKTELLVSERDILDGLVSDLADRLV